jgi:hypothetical protein
VRNSWIAMILLVTVVLLQQQAMSAPVTEEPEMSEIEMHIHGIAQKMDVDMNMDQYKLDGEEAAEGSPVIKKFGGYPKQQMKTKELRNRKELQDRTLPPVDPVHGEFVTLPPKEKPVPLTPITLPPKEKPEPLHPITLPPKEKPEPLPPITLPPQEKPETLPPITLPPKEIPEPLPPITMPPMTLVPPIHHEPVTVAFIEHPTINPPIQEELFTRPTVEYEPVTIPSRLNEMPTRERRRLK